MIKESIGVMKHQRIVPPACKAHGNCKPTSLTPGI